MTNPSTGTAFPLTQEQSDVVVGTILGDASMSFSNSKRTASYICEQSTTHGAYLQSLFDMFKAYVSPDVLAPVEYTRIDKRNNVPSSSVRFATIFSVTFSAYAALFYTEDSKRGAIVKRVPANIADLLTPRALAYWIMDDGQHVVRGGVTLCTDSFTIEDIKMLADILATKYGLQYTFHRGGRRIYISRRSLTVLQQLVGQYMHSSFLYKVHM